MEPLVIVALVIVALVILVGVIVVLFMIGSYLEKAEDKIRSLEEQVDRMEKRKELDAFVEKWAGDKEMDNPDWHKGE